MVTHRNVVLIVTLGLLPFCVRAAGQTEHWLQYHPSANIYRDVGAIAGQHITATPTPSADIRLPTFTGPKPVFGQWSSPFAKNGKVWLAVDQSQKDGFYDRLYIDSNGDASLADETPVKANRSNRYSTEFDPVKVLLEGDDGSVTYHLQFRFRGYDERYRLYATSACWYEGTVAANGRKWRIMLIDYNANGTFNDMAGAFDFVRTDHIGIAPVVEATTASTAASKPGADGQLLVTLLGKYLQLGDAYFHPEAARDGAYIKLTDAGKVPVGNVRAHKEVTQFTAAGPSGLFRPRMVNGVAQFPAGTYRIFDWQMERTDKDGARWKLKGGNGGSGSPFTVTEGKETALAVGEPVKIELAVNTQGPVYTFGQRLAGPLGESVELSRNGDTRAVPPRLEIVNTSGTYRKSLTFEFG